MTDTPGSILKAKREALNLHIAQAAKVTRIRMGYLEALERDDLTSLPSPVQARGFLRAYAQYLGLDPASLLEMITLGGRQPDEVIFTGETELAESQSLAMENSVPETDAVNDKVTSLASVPELGDSPREDEENSEEVPLVGEIDKGQKRQSQEIFAEIGKRLQNQRELLGLSLDEVERQSKVRRHYLENLEKGEFEQLPSSVQGRGMLSAYARFLEFDLDEILLRYADGLQIQREEHVRREGEQLASRNSPRQRFVALRRFLTIDILVGTGLIVVLLLFAFWGTGKVIDLYKTPVAGENEVSISDVILTPLATGSPVSEGTAQNGLEITLTPVVSATQAITLPASGQGQVQVVVVVLQRTWMRVLVDGKVAFEGRALPGNAYPYNGLSQIEVLTGNAAALQIYHNQIDLGVMGIFGEVVDRIYTPSGILQPTATITFTPTISPTPTRTPRPSSTPFP